LVEINADLVGRLVAAQFPHWAHLPVRPVAVGGWDNRAFHLGETMVVRLPSAKRYAPQVEKDQAWLPRLAPHLPLPIPAPLAKGAPGEGYPGDWSIFAWLPGETALAEPPADRMAFARDLAGFLAALQRIDPADGPAAGPHNFFRGGPLATYDAETRSAVAALGDRIDGPAALAVWDAALATTWAGPPVWVHGDVAASNLLVREGRLSAVIDFGSCGVGDPACDLVIAWTFLAGESRAAFRSALSLDAGTWARARGWALWKAAITLAQAPGVNPAGYGAARQVLEDVLAEAAGA
jgi:aminoglycoside phosphotransferase (APT) family kinase protein